MLKLNRSIGNAMGLLLVLTLSAILVSAVGCGDSGPALYTVTGSVSFEGSPVERGTITFEDSALGLANSTELSSGGTYTLQLQEGNYVAAIEPLMGEPAPGSMGSQDYEKVDNIPGKYWAGDTSGLTAQVSEDKSGLDFDMTP